MEYPLRSVCVKSGKRSTTCLACISRMVRFIVCFIACKISSVANHELRDNPAHQ